MCRKLLAGALIALLTLTGQAQATAPGAGAVGQMVICTSAGLATVFIDDSGAPVPPPHLCPDCIAGVVLALAPPASGVIAPDPVIRQASWPPTRHSARRLSRPPQARGPPLPI
ncbi:MAG: hypothetical protein AAGA05_06905 [Pseudomonadota bacterium]